MSYILAIDPGSEHVGLAGAWYTHRGVGRVFGKTIHDYDFALEQIRSHARLPACSLIVCEDWQLYGETMAALQGSRLMEVRMIGRIEEMCDRYRKELRMQPARIMREAAAKMERRRIQSQLTSHAHSAELHLWWYLMRFRPDLTPSKDLLLDS